MEVLYLLIPLSLAMAGGGLCAFVWAMRAGQYQDTLSPAERLVFDPSQESGITSGSSGPPQSCLDSKADASSAGRIS